MKTKFKLTALEHSWILYDIGNSAFILLVVLFAIGYGLSCKADKLNEARQH